MNADFQLGRARHSVRAVVCWWGEATDEPARGAARPTGGGQRIARPAIREIRIIRGSK